jgi:hypothetical protein
VKPVFQPQYSCGPPLTRELTREKHERLFVLVTPSLAAVFRAEFQQARFEGLSDLRVCALMRLPIPVCRPSMNWVRFLVPVSMVTDRMSGQGIDLRNILRHSVGGHDRFPGIRRESPDVLDSLRDAIRREKGLVAIDLTELTLVDREAVTLLATSEVNGIELRNCSAYLREWINKQRESR